MKDVYIVLVVISNTVEIDSVYWNDKKAQNRAKEIVKNSKAKSYVIKKWVNPSIVISPQEYTRDRMAKMSEEFCYPIVQDGAEIIEGTLCLFDKIEKIKNMYPKTFEWMQDKASWKCMPLGAVLQSYENHINKLMEEEGSADNEL